MSQPQWVGHCPGCGGWNTLHEVTHSKTTTLVPETDAVRLADVASAAAVPVPTGLSEFDRALGGGLVPGSVTLLGGEPGIGKSVLVDGFRAVAFAEGLPQLIVHAFIGQEVAHVEQIARVLPVERGTNLPTEKLAVREASRLDECLKPLLHLVRTWQVAEGKEMAAQGGIDLHLDLGLAALAVELDLHPFLALACLGHAGRWQAAFDVRLDPGESLTDRAQGLGPVVDR